MTEQAYIFAGQGAQYVGMGRDLYDSIPACKAVFDEADDVLGFKLSSICFEGPDEELKNTDKCQPAILTQCAAILAALEEQGIAAPDTVTGGLSLGEYTALMFAGVISFKDAVRLVHMRGRFMQEASEATPSGMACILKLTAPQVDEVLTGIDGVSVANLNCPGQVVISGAQSALDQAVEAFNAVEGARVMPLKVAGAFHSAVMEPAREKLAAELESVEFQIPRMPVCSNATGDVSTDPAQLKTNVLEQLVAPVRWEACIRTMMAAGIGAFADIGPKSVLAGLNKRISGDLSTVSYDTLESLKAD